MKYLIEYNKNIAFIIFNDVIIKKIEKKNLKKE